VHVLLTKADKLAYGQQKNTLFAVRKRLADYGGEMTVQTFSALKKTGLEEVWAKLDAWLVLPEVEAV
jgi:GTP-binding protein